MVLRTCLALPLLLLSSVALADPSAAVGRYLSSPPGSEAEGTALEELRPLFAADPLALEAAIREFGGFPVAAPGARSIRVALPPDVSIAGKPVADTLAIVWVPHGYEPSRSWPAILLSHGTGGNASDMVRALAPLSDAHGYLLVCPEEEFGPKDGWGFNDYQHAMHLRALTWLKRNYNVDDSRVFVHGGSRGGHASWDLACSHPDLFAGAIPVSGTLPDRHFRYLPSLRHVAVLSMQGLRDSPNLVENFRAAAKLLEGWKYDITVREDPEAGHFFPVDWDEVADWMKGRRRPDHPSGLVVAATRDEKGRAFWVGLSGLPTRKLENPPPTQYDPRKSPSRGELIRLIRAHYDNYRGLVRGTVKDNVVDLTVEKTPKVVVYLDSALVNLDEPVVVKVNGRVKKRGTFPRSLGTLLERVKETGERRLLYAAAVEVRGAR